MELKKKETLIGIKSFLKPLILETLGEEMF